MAGEPTVDDVRARYRQKWDKVRQRRELLPSNSWVRKSLSDDLLAVCLNRVENGDVNSLKRDWPLIYHFATYVSDEAIVDLDNDISQVLVKTAPHRAASVVRFLDTKPHDHVSQWYSGLFEVFVKATLQRCGHDVDFDVQLPNGRDHDVAVIIGGKRIHFECTVLTEDDESRAVWKRFLEDHAQDKTRMLIRPGKYDLPNAKGPSPYYLPRRIYAKIFDKITKHLDPSRSQFERSEPNLVLISFADVDPNDPGTSWAFEELFAEQPRCRPIVAPNDTADISLKTWVDFTAKELIHQGNLTVEQYSQNWNDILETPTQLAGALIFDKGSLSKARLNYNAVESCSLRHIDMAQLETIFSKPPSYWQF